MKIHACAKLNLTLDITGRRADGYHLLDSVIQSISLYDTVYITAADVLTVRCSLQELTGECNIAAAAARRFFDATGVSGGADIFIEKRIPVASGLGGGSADAAAVLCGLNRLYGRPLSEDALIELALPVGADVPFCIMGGTARVGGIGERLESLPPVTGLYFVIAKNAVKASTGDMYRRLDADQIPPRRDTNAAVAAIRRGDIRGLTGKIGNTFAALTGVYGVDKILTPLKAAAVSLSGSGPSVFAVFEDSAAAEEAVSLLRRQGYECFLTEPVGYGISFV